MLLQKDFDLKLEGSFGTDTTAKAGATGVVPTGELSFGVSTTRTQTLDLPVTVTSLANVPNVYQQYTYTTLKDASPTAADKARMAQTVASLRKVVEKAITDFKPDLRNKPCKEAMSAGLDLTRSSPAIERIPTSVAPDLFKPTP